MSDLTLHYRFHLYRTVYLIYVFFVLELNDYHWDL
nr:MAG TPA: hypothetical protein [Caudoviricetes sp.]